MMLTQGTPLWALVTNVFVAVLGLVVGSFLNVVIVRIPQGKSIAWPGSHCPKCQAAIRWYDNLPVVSYLILRGRCRTCKDSISIRYPVIELLTGLVFLAARLKFGFSPALFIRDFPFLGILIAVTFIDLEHRIIPDVLSLGGLALGLLIAICFSFLPWQWAVGANTVGWLGACIGAAVGFGFFYGLAWIYYALTGRSGLGGGDVKLLAMLGAYLGVQGIFATVLISSVFGSLAGIGWGLWNRRKTKGESLMTTAIPYGPFLVVGGLYYYFFMQGHPLGWPWALN